MQQRQESHNHTSIKFSAHVGLTASHTHKHTPTYSSVINVMGVIFLGTVITVSNWIINCVTAHVCGSLWIALASHLFAGLTDTVGVYKNDDWAIAGHGAFILWYDRERFWYLRQHNLSNRETIFELRREHCCKFFIFISTTYCTRVFYGSIVYIKT